MSKPALLAEPVLVGREKELEELQGFLNSAVEGKGKTVFVSGEAGSGKTKLVTEFLKWAKKQSITILTGWCLSNAAVPYFPFFEAFSTYFTKEQSDQAKEADPSKKETKEVKRTWGPQDVDVMSWLMGPNQAEQLQKSQVISPQVWKDQTFVAVGKTLTAISAEEPVILFIDDLHWADSASLALTHYLARATNSENILLLATYRTEELVTKPEGKINPLVETLRLMRREDLFTEIKIASLNEHDVALLAQNMLAGRVQKELATDLAEESQGNPLFVVESVRMLRERDGLRCENNEWRLSAAKVGVPDKIRDIILQRLDCLTESQRKALDIASVVGERFTTELISSVLNLEAADVIETFDKIGRTTALVYCEGELYKFDHARTRDAVYSEISQTLRKVYHAKVAEELEGRGKACKMPLVDLAYHFAEAGNKDKAVKYALAAGKDTLSRWSNQEAIKHFTYVLQTSPEIPEYTQTRENAQEGLGDAYYANNKFKDAIRTFEDLSNRETGSDKLRALRKAMESTFMYRDISHLMELVNKAEPLAATDPLEHARVLVMRGRVYIFGQSSLINTKLAIEDCANALHVFETEYSLWDAALALLGKSNEAGFGKLHEGLAAALRSVAIFEDLGDFRFQMEACFGTGAFIFALYCCLFDEACGMLRRVLEIDEKTKIADYIRLFHAEKYLAGYGGFLGDWKGALSHGQKALELSEKTDSPVATATAYSILCGIYVRLGHMKCAEKYFETLMKMPQEVVTNWEVMGFVTKAIFLAGQGRWEESNKCFQQLLEGSGPPGGLVLTLDFYAWSLERQERFAEAKTLREKIQKTIQEMQEKFSHVALEASLTVRRKVNVGELFEMRLDLVNVSRKPGQLARAEVLVPLDGFKITSMSPSFSQKDNGVEMGSREIGVFQVVTGKVGLEAVKAGTFTLTSKVVYVDDLGETKTCKLDPIVVIVKPTEPSTPVIAGRVSTGHVKLDKLLFGGIPEKYAIVLSATLSDERQRLIKNYIETGLPNGEFTIYLTGGTNLAKELALSFSANFYAIVCSPQAYSELPNLQNVINLKGTENLTDIDIALTKLLRTINLPQGQPRRACVDLVSDVLLQHHVVITRRWLGSLLPTLKSRGFTVLAVIDSGVHPSEEIQAIKSLFDGEIEIFEKGLVKSLRVKRFGNQMYLEEELPLSKEELLF
jgi:tetratricopeptide (TPR) repeat protein/KaiC/GvpD/RAD55 family RecA-like ATPase